VPNKQLKRVRKVRGKLKVQVEPSLRPVRIKSQEAQGRKVPNRRQVKVRAARKNHKAEPSLHPVRIKSQVKGQKVPNRQQVETRVARKNHKAELRLHPGRKKSQEA
jgi:hypothetical protein